MHTDPKQHDRRTFRAWQGPQPAGPVTLPPAIGAGLPTGLLAGDGPDERWPELL
ncbi:MAG TPA: hypothetical protein VG406_11590 [Isosphaeraceae bacterium]|nr:hypothetical protein [Isosphaeraceae bacterium]